MSLTALGRSCMLRARLGCLFRIRFVRDIYLSIRPMPIGRRLNWFPRIVSNHVYACVPVCLHMAITRNMETPIPTLGTNVMEGIRHRSHPRPAHGSILTSRPHHLRDPHQRKTSSPNSLQQRTSESKLPSGRR